MSIKKKYPDEELFLKFEKNKKNIYDENNGYIIDIPIFKSLII